MCLLSSCEHYSKTDRPPSEDARFNRNNLTSLGIDPCRDLALRLCMAIPSSGLAVPPCGRNGAPIHFRYRSRSNRGRKRKLFVTIRRHPAIAFQVASLDWDESEPPHQPCECFRIGGFMATKTCRFPPKPAVSRASTRGVVRSCPAGAVRSRRYRLRNRPMPLHAPYLRGCSRYFSHGK